jgi:hypothetical protein
LTPISNAFGLVGRFQLQNMQFWAQEQRRRDKEEQERKDRERNEERLRMHQQMGLQQQQLVSLAGSFAQSTPQATAVFDVDSYMNFARVSSMMF